MKNGVAERARGLILHLHERWSELNLAAQFALAALVVLAHGMTLLGTWVTQCIEESVVRNTASGAALYINSFVEPLVQELASAKELSPATHEKLNALLIGTPLGQKVKSIKVWGPDGTILFANNKPLVGKQFPLSARLKSAWNGTIHGEFNRLDDDENQFESALHVPILEIYSPVRESGTDRIIAVAEFYEIATHLHEDLRAARRQSWFVVGTVSVAMFALLSMIMLKGSRTIASQQRTLRDRISELSRLLTLNQHLRQRVDDIHRRSVATNELFLRRVGIELHDGPAQLISLALLRLDALRPQSNRPDADATMQQFQRIQTALTESLAEIRNISAGLSLPELEGLTPEAAIVIAARNHERRTNTPVACEFTNLPTYLPTDLKSCLYRVVQEGLNNAFRHAGGVGQTVRARMFDGVIEVEVIDKGAGFSPGPSVSASNRFGLSGMRDRVASLGGSLEVQSAPGKGTRLTARFKIEDHNRNIGGEVAEHV